MSLRNLVSKKIAEYYVYIKKYYTNRYFVIAAFFGYVFLYFSIQISNSSGFLATQKSGKAVNDVFFNVLPYVDTTFIHGKLSYAFNFIRIFVFALVPDRAILSLLSMGLLLLLRSFFINLTHLGIPADSYPIISNSTFGGDLFFSGHVAVLTLMMFIFWDIRILRYFFLLSSIILGASTILGRFHYSIDVFTAPFIAYGVYMFSKTIIDKVTERYE